jgi:cytochrome c-type biogenesis protein CcmH
MPPRARQPSTVEASILFWAAALALVAGALAFVLPQLAQRRGSRTAIILIAIGLPFAAAGLYWLLGTPEATSDSSDIGADLAPTNAEDYVSRLESHLARQPRDARGWVLLARAHVQAGRFSDASRAFERALAVSPGKVARDPAVLCEYADALAMMQGGQLSGRPLQLVDQALALDSRHPMALEMAGSAAYADGRYSDSVRYWGELLPQLRPGSQRYRELAAAIERARQRVPAG